MSPFASGCEDPHCARCAHLRAPSSSIGILAEIEAAWCAKTSADEGWTAANPALGQCAVTALVVQDLCGGDLLRVVNEGVSHYFNRLPDGAEVDLTRSQFETWSPTDAPEVRTREYVLSFEPTRVRYELLRERVGGAR